jgi:hypothetical protein
MRKASIGLLGIVAAPLLGFLSYGALDRYIYEHGLNLNLKLAALIALVLVIVAAAFSVMAAKTRKSSGWCSRGSDRVPLAPDLFRTTL